MTILSSRFQPALEDHVEEQGGVDDASEDAGSDIPNQNASEEDYTIVLLESLPPLPPLQHNVPFEKTKFSVKPSLKSMDVAQKFVTPLLEEYIKEKVPRLKWLLEVPSVGNFNGVVFNQIIRNKLRTERSDEMWFHLNNMPFRLSKKEFVLISGLNVRKTYNDMQLKERVKDTSFVDKYFPGQKTVDRKDAMRVLEEYKNRHIQRLDRKVHKKVMARLLLGCLIYNYLGNGNGKGLEKKYWCIIADLDFCNSYDWGNFIWDALKRAFDTDPSKWNKNAQGYRTHLYWSLKKMLLWLPEMLMTLKMEKDLIVLAHNNYPVGRPIWSKPADSGVLVI